MGMVVPAAVVYSPSTVMPASLNIRARVVFPAPGIPSSTISRAMGTGPSAGGSEQERLVVMAVSRLAPGDGFDSVRVLGGAGVQFPAGDAAHVDQQRPDAGIEQQGAGRR